jgi:bifunctional non-homologous end joining protein LigD
MIATSVEPQGDGFVVNLAYGRRGSTMATGTKTQIPVDHDSAKHIYDKLVREKMAKGYTQGPEGLRYHSTRPRHGWVDRERDREFVH